MNRNRYHISQRACTQRCLIASEWGREQIVPMQRRYRNGRLWWIMAGEEMDGSLGAEGTRNTITTTTTPYRMFYKVICHDKIANIEFESADCALYILPDRNVGSCTKTRPCTRPHPSLPCRLDGSCNCQPGLINRMRCFSCNSEYFTRLKNVIALSVRGMKTNNRIKMKSRHIVKVTLKIPMSRCTR